MKTFKMFERELEDFNDSIPYLGIPGGALNLHLMVNNLRFHLGYGNGTNSLRHDKEAISNAIPMVSARIQEVTSDIEHAWFFQKESLRQKRDILVRIYHYMFEALDIIAKNE